MLLRFSVDTSGIEDRDQERGKECTCNQSAIRSRVSIVEPVSTDQEQRTRHSEGKQSGMCVCVCVSTVEAMRSRASNRA